MSVFRLNTIMLLTTLVASSSAFAAPHPAPVKKTLSYAARQRQHNRELLRAKQQLKLAHTTPVVRGNAQAKAALRAQNRRRLEQHPEWFTPMRSHLQDGTGLVNNRYLMHVTDTIIQRLQQQLGKPYGWAARRRRRDSTVAGWSITPITACWRPNCRAPPMPCTTSRRREILPTGIYSAGIYSFSAFTVVIKRIIWGSIWGTGVLLNLRVPESAFVSVI